MVDVGVDVEHEVGAVCANATLDSPRWKNTRAATISVAKTIQLREKFAIVSARTTRWWDRCRHRRPESRSDSHRHIATVLHRPAAAAQFFAKVQFGLLVFWILTLPFDEVITAVSPGWVSSMHWKLSVQTRLAPSCSTTVVTPRCARISRMVPRTPMVASPVVIL